jgi:Carbohydrate family 9 binding domain-like
MSIARPRIFLASVLTIGALSCVEQSDEKVTPEDQEMIKKNVLSAAPAPQFAVNADLDGKVVYLGLDASPTPVEPGKEVKVTQYWKVVSAPGTGWRLFNHVSGPNNAGYQNRDHGPIRGKYPVAQWKTGDIIRDEFTFSLPPTWQFATVEIYSGLWRGAENMAVKSGPHDGKNRVLAATLPVKLAGPPPLKRYTVRKTLKAPKLDGKLDEPEWQSAPTVGMFVDTMTGGPAAIKTDAKLLWDAQNLYIGFENLDTDVWGNYAKRDDTLWKEEADEVMIDADSNGKSYIELQVSPRGTIFDTYLPTRRKYEDSLDPKRKPYDWNSKVKAAVHVDGTLNKRDDQDKGWTVEIALPLADVNGLDKPGAKVPPNVGDMWRMNLFRLDAPKNKAGVAAAWSPPLVPDFHELPRFGEIVFGDDKGELPSPHTAAVPVDPKAAKTHAGQKKKKK